MMRRTIAILPFIAPFVIYGVYFLLVRRRARADGSKEPSLAEAPWISLVIAGLVLLIASLVWLAIDESGGISGAFDRARFEDGKIVPGQFE